MPATANKPILLIDDDAVQLRVRQAVLQQAGFLIETATSGDEALRLLQPVQSREFAAVITDHLLAESSGAELVPQIREIQPNIPIVIITGLPGAEEEYAGWNVLFRQKPVPPDELIALARIVTQRTDPS